MFRNTLFGALLTFLLGLNIAHADDGELLRTCGGRLSDKITISIKIEACTEYLKNNPTSGHTYYMRATAYYLSGQYDLAGIDAEKAVGSYSEAFQKFQLYTFLAEIYSAAGRHKEVIYSYERALGFEQLSMRHYITRAMSYEALGDKSKAVADYRKALALAFTEGGSIERNQILKGLQRLNVKP